MKYYAIKLKAMRQARGWDQEEIAHMAGVNVRTIQRIEAGNPCSLDTMKGLAAALELPHFSKLLPDLVEKEDSQEKVTWWDLFRVTFRRMVWNNLTHSLLLSMAIIGTVTSMAFVSLGDEDISPFKAGSPAKVEISLSELGELTFVDLMPDVVETAEEEVLIVLDAETDGVHVMINGEDVVNTSKDDNKIKFEAWEKVGKFPEYLFMTILMISSVLRFFFLLWTYEYQVLVFRPISVGFSKISDYIKS